MADKKKIEAALLEGATEGLSGDALYTYVVIRVGKASRRKVSNAAFHLLTDTSIVDRNLLNVIYALALKYRLEEEGGGDE